MFKAKKASAKTSKKKPAKTLRKRIDSAQVNHMVQERAYYVWEEWGRPGNREQDIWCQAEKDIEVMLKK